MSLDYFFVDYISYIRGCDHYFHHILQDIFADTLVENKDEFLESFLTQSNFIRWDMVVNFHTLSFPVLSNFMVSVDYISLHK